ncbi:MAG: glycosyl transferase family 2 [Clostridia bacterium]|nr:glycosyl transferase family 2 [Clostridia bacterium]
MDKKLYDITRGAEDNRILPFFWLHGDDQDKFASELDKVEEAGIHAICIESRPHPDFCGERWWADCDIIMAEAKKRGMKVWVLDDRHYPTGIANGMVAKKYPERRKWHMIEKHVDVVGPQRGAIIVHGDEENQIEKARRLLAAVACRRDGPEEKMTGPAIDLTQNVKGDFLYWDVPEGCWRVYLIFISREGAAGHMADFIHMIDPESVDVLINEVYEPHFEHYGAEFGKTFAGFFSDEPALGNSFLRGVPVGGYDYAIGLQLLALPWRDDMPEMFEARLGPDWKLMLPGLWRPLEGITAKVRLAYMDIMTGLYRDCFAMRIGNWCRERGVEYIGHVIEDMNCHGRMGMGTGHYFRALEGQDMAGIDVVLHQIEPGKAHFDHNSRAGYGSVDSTFYHYMLGKLGASLAYMTPHMKGRTMCEIFGAYGWAEGVPMMKWLIDHMLVRGVNHFVPHAFDTHYPLKDCPPHFYARGNNPQFRDFATLMRYTNRMSHLLTDGLPMPDAGVFYHAEAEWTGDNYMLSEVPAKALLDAQLDYVFVPADALESAKLNASGELELGLTGASGTLENGYGEPYGKITVPCLVMPEAGTLPEAVMKKLSELAAAGFPVAFVDSVTSRSDQGPAALPASVKAFALAELPEFVRGASRHGTVNISPAFPLLRVFRYERGGCIYFMVFNEDMRPFSGTLTLPLTGVKRGAKIDFLYMKYAGIEACGDQISLELSPYESCVLAFGEDVIKAIEADGSLLDQESSASNEKAAGNRTLGIERFDISRCTAPDYPEFTPVAKGSPLFDITGPECDTRFCGYIRYEAKFEAKEGERLTGIDIGYVGETALVKINGIGAGSVICPPYRIRPVNASSYTSAPGIALKGGTNALTIEVANSMAYLQRDKFSVELMVSASGLLGPVKLEIAENA